MGRGEAGVEGNVRVKSRWRDMRLLGGWSGRNDPRIPDADKSMGEASTWRLDMRAVKATVEFAIKVWRFSAE